MKRREVIMNIIVLSDNLLVHKQLEGRKEVYTNVPDTFDPEVPTRFVLPRSGRMLDVLGTKTRVLTSRDFGNGRDAYEEFRHVEENIKVAFYQAGIYNARKFGAPVFHIAWDSLAPVPGGPLPDTSYQSMSLGLGQFDTLFFVRPSEQFMAEKENRAPVPDKTGSIRLGNHDYRPGPLRLMEVDPGQNLTGWEAQTTITGKKSIWHGPLKRITAPFAHASGFINPNFAVKGLARLYNNMGRSIHENSAMTAVIFEPVRKENVGFRVLQR